MNHRTDDFMLEIFKKQLHSPRRLFKEIPKNFSWNNKFPEKIKAII